MQNRVDKLIVFMSKVFCPRETVFSIDFFTEFVLTHRQTKGLSSFFEALNETKYNLISKFKKCKQVGSSDLS